MKKIVVLGTGGTIAGLASSRFDNTSYQAAQVGVDDLLRAVLGSENSMAAENLELEQVAQVDSKDMNWVHWQALHDRALHHLQRDEVDGLVITHGTDTLEETAFFLARVLPIKLLSIKPVVMTCSMRPASSAVADGPQNLRDSLLVSRSVGANGVLVCCASTIHTAWDVQKVHPYRTDAFSSGEAGPVGCVEEGQVRWIRNWALVGADRDFGHTLSRPFGEWPRVEIVINAVGVGGRTVRSICAAPTGADSMVQGLIVAGTGNGTVNSEMASAIESVRAQGVRVVFTSRCHLGQLVSSPGTEPIDIAYRGLSMVKARIALTLELLGV